MANTPQPPPRRRSLLSPEGRRDIVRWLGGGLAGLFFGGLIWFPDIISGFFSSVFSATPSWFMPFVPSVLFCVVTLFEFGWSSTVPARLQLMLYAVAVLAGFVWTWAANLIGNYWFGIVSLIVTITAIRVAAGQLIKIGRAQIK